MDCISLYGFVDSILAKICKEILWGSYFMIYDTTKARIQNHVKYIDSISIFLLCLFYIVLTRQLIRDRLLIILLVENNFLCIMRLHNYFILCFPQIWLLFQSVFKMTVVITLDSSSQIDPFGYFS